ncbi:MAG: hypothetical protein N3A38_05795 [Planctomycetota bacterium]|nr:hypothetical protein [Planctomycetota bacterium]
MVTERNLKVLALAAALGLAAAGCGRQTGQTWNWGADQPPAGTAEKKEEAKEPGKTGEAAAPAAAEPGKAGEAKPAPGGETASPPGGSPEERAKRLLEEEAAKEKIRREARRAEADHKFQAGLKLYQDIEYELALREFENALRIDPTHEKAKEYLRRTRAILGRREDKVAEQLKALDNQTRAKIEETLLALQNALEEAEKLEREGSGAVLEEEYADKEAGLAEQIKKLRAAQDRLTRVREIIRWMPLQVNLAGEQRRTDEAMARVKAKISDKEAEIQMLRREAAMKAAEELKVRESELHKARIKKLLEQAKDLYERSFYREAENLAIRILQIDPFNSEAESLKMRARQRKHELTAAKIRKDKKEQYLCTWEEIEREHVPIAADLVYPSNWDEIVARTDKMAIVGDRAEPEWKKTIRRQLERKVAFEFLETPLQECIAFLRTLTNVNMIVDPKAVQGDGPRGTLTVHDMPLDMALQWILRLAELDYALRDDAIFISKPANLREDVTLRIYDVRDLTMEVHDFPGPDLQLQTVTGAGAGGGLPPLPPPPEAPAVTVESISELIRTRIKPESWDVNLGTSIEQKGGRLVVMQRPEVHRLIDQLLANLRSAQKIQVVIESRFLTIRESFLESIGVDWGGLDTNVLFGDFGDLTQLGMRQPRQAGGTETNPPNTPFPGLTQGIDSAPAGTISVIGAITNHLAGFFSNDPTTISGLDTTGHLVQMGLNSQLTVLNNTQMQLFIKALTMPENTSSLLTPRLTVFNTQRAHMFVARQRSYVGDYEISGDAYDPVIRQFLEGVVLDVKPIVSADRKYITLEMRPTVTELVNFQTRQLDAFNVMSGANANLVTLLSFPIQFPELRISRVRTTVTIPDGGIIMMGGLHRNIRFTSEEGVPFISDIPIVGRLFRWNNLENARSSLAILVTARILIFSEEEAKL